MKPVSVVADMEISDYTFFFIKEHTPVVNVLYAKDVSLHQHKSFIRTAALFLSVCRPQTLGDAPAGDLTIMTGPILLLPSQ